jgi:hypothetical protein
VPRNSYVPSVSHADVLRIVGRDYPHEEREVILDQLNRYGRESWHMEIDRVRIAILMLAEADTGQVAGCVEMACRDYRDVLAWAEYPNAMRLGFPDGPDAAARRQEARKADEAQYYEWLRRA